MVSELKRDRYIFCKHLNKKLKISADAVPETVHGWGWICDCVDADGHPRWTGLDPDAHIVVE